MKICYIANINCIHAQRMVKFFQSTEHEIHLITPSTPIDNQLEDIIGKRTICHFVTPIKPGLRNVFIYLKITKEVSQKIREIKPDILHGHYLTDCGFIGAMTNFHPYITFAYGSDVLVDPEVSFLKKIIVKFVIHQSDIIHCDSEFLKSRILHYCKNSQKLRLVFPCIDLHIFRPQKKDIRLLHDYSFTKNNIIILSDRMLEPLYNIEYLIHTIPDITKEFPEVRYLILGDGRSKGKLEEMVESLNVKKYVRFCGFIPHQQLPQFLNLADIYVSTSLSDSTSVSLLEAMACGKPIIATNIPGNREWVRDGKNGFLFTIQNSKKFIKKLKILIEDVELRQQIKKHNVELVTKNAHIHNSMSQLADIYAEAVNQYR